MSCRLSSLTVTKLRARLAVLESDRDELDTAISAAIKTPQSYRFDDGEGSQMTKNRSLKDLQEARRLVESEISRIENRLSRTGIVNHGLRRA